jgi:chromosome segregation ATPase
VETERLGLRLGQEVIYLKEKVKYWKDLYERVSDELSSAKTRCAELELHTAALKQDLEAMTRENAELRVKISIDSAACYGAQAESGRAASAREDALLALVNHAESEATRLRSICDDKIVEVARTSLCVIYFCAC